ncbi:hypothetical protein JYG23_12350 [Sedimentibacter sp. zth1]|uniref:hypothetical protein n=1 Tax=Sedimentibacter sp. zth1 TaxID=2816908 RepID=UPI001A927774|nr:hypothetical protein [Sedimentibacter sp. zth1]QSX05459.1 hypothetical protein JYG23_12350 [Sedimentibacter sp. zth1]
MFIIIFFAMLTIIIMLVGYIILEKTVGNKTENKPCRNNTETYDPNSQLIKVVNLKKTLGIKSIKNNLITTEDSNLTCLIDVSTPEFNLMTEEDQTLYENRMIELVFKLNFSIKILTIIRNKNLKSVIKNLELNRADVKNENLNSYSMSFQNELIKEQNNKTIKKYYAIYTKEKGTYEQKLKELQKKASTFIKGMQATGCRTQILTTNESLELLNTVIKKYEKLDIQSLEENNVFDIAI